MAKQLQTEKQPDRQDEMVLDSIRVIIGTNAVFMVVGMTVGNPVRPGVNGKLVGVTFGQDGWVWLTLHDGKTFTKVRIAEANVIASYNVPEIARPLMVEEIAAAGVFTNTKNLSANQRIVLDGLMARAERHGQVDKVKAEAARVAAEAKEAAEEQERLNGLLSDSPSRMPAENPEVPPAELVEELLGTKA